MLTADELTRYAADAPLVAFSAEGFGPFAVDLSDFDTRQHPLDMGPTLTAAQAVADSAGATGQRLLYLIFALGGTMTDEDVVRETVEADPDDVEATIERLCTLGLIRRNRRNGDLTFDPSLEQVWEKGTRSMADRQAITAESLTQICKKMGLVHQSRKQERIDALAAHFADPHLRAETLNALPRPAHELLDSLAEIGGGGITSADPFGLTAYQLNQVEPSRLHYARGPVMAEVQPLFDLTTRGIVGVDPYDNTLWIWEEAWPMLDRPHIANWPTVTQPEVAPLTEVELRLPPLMALVERAISRWTASPPKVLKNDDQRFAKTEIRAAAKALGSTSEIVEMICRLLVTLRLFLPNTVAVEGRGRNRRVNEVWMADPDLADAWASLPLQQRWLCLIAEWTDPDKVGLEQLHANRHLLLWELASLPAGTGWTDPGHLAQWLDHRHGPIGRADDIAECLGDLQALGVVTTDGPIGLTALGRLAVEDVDEAATAPLGTASEAVVQADHTIIAPPDLDPTIAARLERIADLESGGGAQVYRLNEDLITVAVQHGDDAEAISGFLDDLSSVPLADTVRRLVADAAARAGRVKVVAATTVVVTSDPADLATACSVKAAKLEAVAPTVAISTETPAKVRAALDRKGLSPEFVSGDQPDARRSSDIAADLEARAEEARRDADRSHYPGYDTYADELAEAAANARNPSLRLKVEGPLALTPALVDARAKARKT